MDVPKSERRLCSGIFFFGPKAMEVCAEHGLTAESFVGTQTRMFFEGCRQLHEEKRLFGIQTTPDGSMDTILYEDLVVRMKLMTLPEFVELTKDIPSWEAPLSLEMAQIARRMKRDENARRIAAQAEIVRQRAKDGDPEAIAEAMRSLATVEVVEKPRATWNQTGMAQEGIAQRRIAGQEDPADRGLSWPWPILDEQFRPLARRELCIVAGGPSRGKSSLARQMALAVAKAQKAVAFVSLEVPAGDVFNLLAQTESRRPWTRLGSLHPAEQRDYIEAGRRVRALGINVLDDTARIGEITAWLRRMHQRRFLDLVVIDYLGLIAETNPARGETKAQAVGRVAAECKALAKEFDCPVVLLVQINREATKDDNRPPRMSDLKDSGDTEAHADRIIIVHRPTTNPLGGARQTGTERLEDSPRWYAEILQEKGRNVGTGSAAAWFEREIASFQIVKKAESAGQNRGLGI